MKQLTLKVLPDNIAVCRLPVKEDIPLWALQGKWFSVTKTEEEMSVVCDGNLVPNGVISEKDWRMMKVEGVLDFSLIGILSEISTVLAEASVSVFVVSTYDTDYIMVKQNKLADALHALYESGYEII